MSSLLAMSTIESDDDLPTPMSDNDDEELASSEAEVKSKKKKQQPTFHIDASAIEDLVGTSTFTPSATEGWDLRAAMKALAEQPSGFTLFLPFQLAFWGLLQTWIFDSMSVVVSMPT